MIAMIRHTLADPPIYLSVDAAMRLEFRYQVALGICEIVSYIDGA